MNIDHKDSELLPGLTLHSREDGVWLSFSSAGKNASISLTNIALYSSPIIQEAMLSWLRDYAKTEAIDLRYECVNCGKGEMSRDEYERQLDRVESPWRCPRCGEYPIGISATFGEYISEVEAAFQSIADLPKDVPDPFDDKPTGFVVTAEGEIGQRLNTEEEQKGKTK